jgi:hypothetical protein
MTIFAGALFLSCRRIGMSLASALVVICLIVLHPATLRTAITGPAETVFALFLFLLVGALFDLRARSAASEVMAVAFALLGLAFSHPMGAALVCSAVPLLIFSVRPEMLANSVINLVIALLFPTVFCIGAFAYISWVFPGNGWSFLIAPDQSVANWAAGFSDLFGNVPASLLALVAGGAFLVVLLSAAPVVPVAIFWALRRRPLIAPVIVIVAMASIATFIAVNTDLFGDPVALAIVPPILAAIVIIRFPMMHERLTVVLPLLVLGWIGGLIGLTIMDPRAAMNVKTAIDGHSADPERVAAIQLGKATIGYDGIMVDIYNAPGIVLGRGRANGLLSPFDETFALGVMLSRIETPFVAVPDPQTGIGAQDQLNKAFPRLYRYGAAGYRLVYDNASWRIFARE